MKEQIILYGPPGTGKTYLAKKIGEENYKDRYKLIQFHQSYSYEDFIRGVEVGVEGNKLKYNIIDKAFLSFAKKASKDRKNEYLLIIDEINRAPLSSVLGELLYSLEYREQPISLYYAMKEGDIKKDSIIIPKNLHIIGTMNTADKSISEIDYAVRRRFYFVNIPATGDEYEEEVSNDGKKFAKKIFSEIEKVFKETNLSRGVCSDDIKIGESYFFYKDDDHLEYKIKYEILPMLKEYFNDGILNKHSKCSEYMLTEIFNCVEEEEKFIGKLLELGRKQRGEA